MKKRNLGVALAGLLAVVTLAIVSFTGDPQQTIAADEPEKTFGMWVWQQKWLETNESQDSLVAFCDRFGINQLMFQIPLVPQSAETGKPRIELTDELARLIAKASASGIRIEALDGDVVMGRAVHHAKALAVLDMVLEFNRKLPPDARLTGMHYDIEPYVLPSWNTGQRRSIMREYLTLMRFARAKLHREDPPMRLGASIPFWYDRLSSEADSCVLEYNGERKNFHMHIQDETDYVVVMSYRRNAEGENSITYHTDNEIGYADQTGHTVLPALETIELKETPDLSFHGLPPEEFWLQKQTVEEMFSGRPGFGGIMVHDYQGLHNLLSHSAARASR